MKLKKAICMMLSSVLFSCSALTALAAPVKELPQSKLPASERREPVGEGTAASQVTERAGTEEEAVLRNTVFTTSEMMRQMMGKDDSSWSVFYLPEVEQIYWNFSADGEQEKRELSMNLVSNAYQNLEMFLDNGYLLDYQELEAYAADYLVRKGEADTYYQILTDCLKNPYLLHKPQAEVTDTTYNGRDYSSVFDPDYYYDNNPDLQVSIGFNPPELLRHFVEKGIIEGRKGNAEFDLDTYIAYTDGQILLGMAGAQAPGAAPSVAKYSYSRANYYGKLLGHYEYAVLTAEENEADW